jgi:hypothetical protein
MGDGNELPRTRQCLSGPVEHVTPVTMETVMAQTSDTGEPVGRHTVQFRVERHLYNRQRGVIKNTVMTLCAVYEKRIAVEYHRNKGKTNQKTSNNTDRNRKKNWKENNRTEKNRSI